MNKVGPEELQNEAVSMEKLHDDLAINIDPYIMPTSNVANRYTATINKPLLAKGLGLYLEINITNTTNCTLNLNGWGNKPIRCESRELTAGELKVGVPYHLKYNGTAFILQGKGGEPIDSKIWIPKTYDQIIPKGKYLLGDQIIKGYPDLLPENIANGKNIGDVIGAGKIFKSASGFCDATITAHSGVSLSYEGIVNLPFPAQSWRYNEYSSVEYEGVISGEFYSYDIPGMRSVSGNTNSKFADLGRETLSSFNQDMTILTLRGSLWGSSYMDAYYDDHVTTKTISWAIGTFV